MNFNPFGSLYGLYEKKLWREIAKGPFPHHVALIMDGNRRFAVAQRKMPSQGHLSGTNKLKNVLQWVWDLPEVKILTLFAFSTENFKRPNEEVDTLTDLLEENFLKLSEDNRVHENKVRIKAIGRLHLLRKSLQEAITTVEEATKQYEDRILQIAVGYSGRAELVDAVQGIVSDIQKGIINGADQINEKLVERYLYTNGVSDPDIIIRTSGEERLSGFLMWQSAYSELYFADIFWPGFRRIDLWRAIRVYQKRNRRFGR